MTHRVNPGVNPDNGVREGDRALTSALPRPANNARAPFFCTLTFDSQAQ